MQEKTKNRKVFKFFHALPSFQRKYLRIPFGVFMLLFVILPILIILFYAFTYTIQDSSGVKQIVFSGQAFINFFTSWSKINVLIVSLFIALITTIVCLLIGYPLAYFLADKKINKNAVFVTLFVAPMWINFVIRTMATRDLLFWLGISGGTTPYLATIIGMVQNYLPFVILPLYSTMIKLDKSQVEAAVDLGCTPTQAFIKNVIPQSVPGIISACTMTFMPTMSSYVISDVLSEGKITLFGSYIELEFSNSAWHDGSFMALILLIIIGVTMIFTSIRGKNSDEGGSLL